MPQPILWLDEEVYHFAKRFDALSRTTASATGSPTVAPQSLNRGKERDKPPLRIILVVQLSRMIIGLAVLLFRRSSTVCPTLAGVSSNTLESCNNGTYTNTKYGGSWPLSFDNITEDQQGHIMGSAMVTISFCSFHGTVPIVNHITITVFNCTYGQAVDFTGTIYSDDHLEGTWNHGI